MAASGQQQGDAPTAPLQLPVLRAKPKYVGLKNVKELRKIQNQ